MSMTSLLSCNKSKELVIDYYQPQLVVEGYLHNNKPITLSVRRNLQPNEKVVNFPITDAKVTVWEDSLEMGVMQHDSNGIYSISYIPRNNHSYRIKVEHPDFPTAEGYTSINEPVHANVISSKIDGIYRDIKIQLLNDNMRYYGFQAVEKSLSQSYFFDNIGEKYYYSYQSINYFSGIEFLSLSHYWKDEIALSTFQITNDPENAGEILFGNSKTLTSSYITLKTYSFSNVILINELSEDVYQFFRSIVIYQKRTESSLTSSFYTPSFIHSNIKNGVDIFGYIYTYEFPVDSIPSDCNDLF